MGVDGGGVFCWFGGLFFPSSTFFLGIGGVVIATITSERSLFPLTETSSVDV